MHSYFYLDPTCICLNFFFFTCIVYIICLFNQKTFNKAHYLFWGFLFPPINASIPNLPKHSYTYIFFYKCVLINHIT